MSLSAMMNSFLLAFIIVIRLFHGIGRFLNFQVCILRGRKLALLWGCKIERMMIKAFDTIFLILAGYMSCSYADYEVDQAMKELIVMVCDALFPAIADQTRLAFYVNAYFFVANSQENYEFMHHLLQAWTDETITAEIIYLFICAVTMGYVPVSTAQRILQLVYPLSSQSQ